VCAVSLSLPFFLFFSLGVAGVSSATIERTTANKAAPSESFQGVQENPANLKGVCPRVRRPNPRGKEWDRSKGRPLFCQAPPIPR
jgi:hypothetical protein